jgi:UPF0755 protein
MFARFAKLVAIVIGLAAAAAAALLIYLGLPIKHPPAEIAIEQGMTVEGIADALHEKGVIKCPLCFKAYVIALGKEAKLHAGDYEFEDGLSTRAVVHKLLKGDFKVYWLTIPEGWTVRQIADYLRSSPSVANPALAGDLLTLSRDKGFINSLDIGWDADSLEGYLFPSTYQVYKLRDAGKLIAQMIGEFKKRFAAEVTEGAPQKGLKPADIVTLASIVEKETGNAAERPSIASVFYNRLKAGMPLQSDPTVIYGLPNYNGNIRKEDLSNPHPYNTYVHSGIPPGPIANPGAASIEAVLHPAETKYLYFVSKNDGTHYFSETYPEHRNAVIKYQVRREGKSPLP